MYDKKVVRALLVVAAVTGTVRVQADVFNMGGTRDAYGRWTGLASLETVPVGNPGNAGKLSGASVQFGHGPDAIVGSVAYTFNMGKFEVTAAQYTAFLNAVAKTDTYGLYNVSMWSDAMGCQIERLGSPGNYSYYADTWADLANRPANFVSWGDAARFCNWLSNGQPTGAQGIATTEDGSYYLNGVTSQADLMAVTRKAGATWVIPTEDEWYKAAYHKNDGVTDHYWDYPIGSDTRPSNVLLVPDPGNSANFYDSLATPPYTIGFDLYRTPVGQFVRSQSPYGTFDQGGNIKEWDETAVYAGLSRGVRGGDWDSSSLRLAARYRGDGNPTVEGYNLGFRIAGVPEPGSVAMLISAGVAALLWCNRRK